MALKTSPFPNGFAAGIHAVGWVFILPCFWCLNHLLAVCHPTTQEQTQQLEQECYLYPLKAFFGSIILFILFLTTAPLAFLGFLLWAPVQAYRRPFCYYRAMQSSPEKETHRGFELVGKASFGFVTANVCLLPEAIARFNNIGHTRRRAAAIGQHIVQGVCRPDIQIFVDSPSSCGNVAMPCDVTEESWAESPSVLLSSNQNPNQQGQMVHRSAHRALLSQGLHQQDDVPWEVSSMFPASVDIVCLEEVFDKGAAQKLIQALRPVFGHILYDVGVYACYPPCRCSSFKFMNSGLFLASRFPVLEARYCCFPNCRGEDALAAKGLLSAKVLIGQNQKRKKVVGYINCTHLDAPEGDGQIRYEQLNMITKWTGDFQTAYRQPDEDVAFDVLCGDFNFDNCSPGDAREQNHCLFEEYRDPCRAGPGKEKPWAIGLYNFNPLHHKNAVYLHYMTNVPKSYGVNSGLLKGTLLEQPTLYEDDVNTPENLQRYAQFPCLQYTVT
uniref:sphingomyelin phosphodiesterase n=1 Tax=Monopterus albus TaxID=43700 RepID=A0A3Q3JBT3_MONAL